MPLFAPETIYETGEVVDDDDNDDDDDDDDDDDNCVAGFAPLLLTTSLALVIAGIINNAVIAVSCFPKTLMKRLQATFQSNTLPSCSPIVNTL